MSLRRRSGRAAAVVALAAAVLALPAAPAAAHGRGVDTTNYDSRVTQTPELPGVTWDVVAGDHYLVLSNEGADEVVVHGYDGEPYLRVGPDGVFENRRSPATYLNEDQYALVEVPDSADPGAAPLWERVSGRTTYAWHDHRIHYMSPNVPPEIADDPRTERIVPGFERWEVPFTHAGVDHVVAGELRWVPGPAPWPWLALGLAVALPALAGLRTSPREGAAATGRPVRSWPGLARPAAVVLGLAVALNATRLVDDLLAVPLPAAEAAFAAAQTALFLGIGTFGAWRAWHGGDGAFTALGVGSGAVLVGQGLLAVPVLTSSQLASLLPAGVVRFVVALSVMQAVTVGAVAVIGTRRLLPAQVDEPAG